MRNIKRREFVKEIGMGAAGVLVLGRADNARADKPAESSRELIAVKPVDNGKALINPEMGWMLYFYSNVISNYGSKLAPSDTMDDFPGLSTVFMRVPWSFIEIEEGKFNWELLDTPSQRWIDKGKKVAFLISASESWMRYATPEWVKKAGAKGYEWNWQNSESLWEPDFSDTVFLLKVENFVAAMANRYDGNPNIAFVSIGHFGLWGEGHTLLSSHLDYSLEVMEKHVDIYCRHFKHTRLFINDDFAGHDKPGKRFPITDYAFSKGVSLTDDSILVDTPPRSWYHAEMAQLFWPSMPVALEHQHYGMSLNDKAWSKDLLLKSIEDYHASYMSVHWWPREFLEANNDIIDTINLRMGYRIQLSSISWPKEVKLGENFKVAATWANTGVAPCYPGGFPCITLKDEKGGIISVLADENFDMKDLKVAAPGNAPIREWKAGFAIARAFNDPVDVFFRVVLPGNYDLYVSVGKRDGTPVIELPYGDDDGHHRYKMGRITVLDRNT
jgi:hypothetical protein